jgi:hypothetical protein
LARHGEARAAYSPGARIDGHVLVPREDSIELIPAQTDATVVRIRVLPGAKVTPDTILMDLTDPQLSRNC